jgi:hypothetical protein
MKINEMSIYSLTTEGCKKLSSKANYQTGKINFVDSIAASFG